MSSSVWNLTTAVACSIHHCRSFQVSILNIVFVENHWSHSYSGHVQLLSNGSISYQHDAMWCLVLLCHQPCSSQQPLQGQTILTLAVPPILPNCWCCKIPVRRLQRTRFCSMNSHAPRASHVLRKAAQAFIKRIPSCVCRRRHSCGSKMTGFKDIKLKDVQKC